MASQAHPSNAEDSTASPSSDECWSGTPNLLTPIINNNNAVSPRSPPQQVVVEASSYNTPPNGITAGTLQDSIVNERGSTPAQTEIGTLNVAREDDWFSTDDNAIDNYTIRHGFPSPDTNGNIRFWVWETGAAPNLDVQQEERLQWMNDEREHWRRLTAIVPRRLDNSYDKHL